MKLALMQLALPPAQLHTQMAAIQTSKALHRRLPEALAIQPYRKSSPYPIKYSVPIQQMPHLKLLPLSPESPPLIQTTQEASRKCVSLISNPSF